MRNHSTPLYKQLTAAGTKAPTLTPGAGVTPQTFNLIGLPTTTDGKRNYMTAIVVRVTQTLDPDAAGNAIPFDKLYKGVSTFRLSTPLLGDVFQAQHTRGAVLGHFYQVLGGGYTYPQPARIQIPASTDADVTVDLYFLLPFAFEFLVKPHETAPFVGWFDQGELEIGVGPTTAYDGDYAGLVTKATCTLRAWAEFLPSPDNFIAVPFQFREYQVPGSSTEFILRGFGGASGLKGITGDGCGLVAMAWLTDATGIGLSGADGVDEITRIDLPWRKQNSIDTVDPWFVTLRRMCPNRVGPISGLGTTIVHDGAGWPYTMSATPDNALANAQAMFLPLVMPGRNFETSKAQHLKGDLTINMSFGTTPSGQSRFATLELYEYDVVQLEQLTRAMGIDPDKIAVGKKAYNQSATAKQVRYTRTMLGD